MGLRLRLVVTISGSKKTVKQFPMNRRCDLIKLSISGVKLDGLKRFERLGSMLATSQAAAGFFERVSPGTVRRRKAGGFVLWLPIIGLVWA
jgi:hypothetical protein